MAFPDSEFFKRGESLISPFDPKRVQPASYDLGLQGELLVPALEFHPKPLVLDLRKHKPKEFMRSVKINEGFILMPGESVLGSTIETIHCPNDCVARVEGKSSLGRLFLAVHVTAGFIDPGFQGQVTLEIVNHGPWAVTLWENMPIAQINFSELLYPCANPYGTEILGSHYQYQKGPTAASGERSNKKK